VNLYLLDQSGRFQKNTAVTLECCFCHASEDDWRNLLIDCAMGRGVQALFDEELLEHIAINQSRNAMEWIFFLIDSLNHSQLVNCVITLCAI
jgi:hypothetical protein